MPLLPLNPSSVSFLARARYRIHYPRRHVSTKSTDPLRILFCGSDSFSIASLRALFQEQRSNPGLIESIDVVCKEPKRVGRGLKVFRAVPLSQAARDMNLPLHEINTFTKWEPPKPLGGSINLIITVSFGLFVPSRILFGAKYGGLNVHPSMLPDFRGPAPLHHTLLCNEENTGLTLQTLSSEEVDGGQILAQSEYPGFRHSCNNVPDLLALVSPKAAEMLVRGLRDLVYVPPRQDVGWNSTSGSVQAVRYAPKITTEDRHIDWNTWPAERILRTHRVIGPLWNTTEAFEEGTTLAKRVIWSSGFQEASDGLHIFPQPGHPIVNGLQSATKSILIKTCDGHALQVSNVKIEGSTDSASPCREFKKFGMVSYPNDPGAAANNFAPFRGRLM